MKKIDGGLNNVPGYLFSALECGIRYQDRLDYTLIVSETPCQAAGVFTTNKVCAAPVKLCRKNIGKKIKAILINATNANACTGTEGYKNAEILTADIASRLGTEPSSILMASTGIIGHQLPMKKMLDAHPHLISSLSRDEGGAVARAIMTTDTVPKESAVSFSTTKGDYIIAGCAKGAGMIAPNMATLLCFLLTDAPVKPAAFQAIFKRTIAKTLNAITIDGDTSTNDTALLLGPAGSDPLKNPDDLESFEEALHSVLLDLSEQLVRDGEGATKLVKVRVINAGSVSDAEKAARSISQSLLFKTALFGRDPNWGRIAAAVGYSGASVKEETLSVYFENMPLLENGTPIPFDKNEINDILARREFSITVDLGLGKHEASMLTCDISFDYVKINAEYAT